MDITGWEIEFYESNNGISPVYEYILKLRPQAKAKAIHLIDLLSKYGNALGLPHSRSLGGGLFELRIRGKEEARIIYCFLRNKRIILLHAFKKQTQETPRREILIADKRKLEVKD